MKKRVLALMIAVLSVFMTACGGSGTADVEEVAEESTVEDEVVEESEEAVVEEESEETAVEESEEATVEESEEVVEEVVEEETAEETVAEGSYYPGVLTETGYESEYLGFRYTTPEGFTIATEEEMEEMSDAGEELLSEDYSELQLAYADIVTINELMVSDSLGVVNFNITLEKTSVDLETYIELFKEQISGLSAMAIEIIGEEEAELAGSTYTKLTAQVESQGVVMYQDYYLRKQDDRLVALIVTWLDGMDAEKDTMMSGFAAY